MPAAEYQRVPERIVVIAIHALLFFGWTLFLIYQAWLGASGNIAHHRDVGLIGVSLATAMIIFGTLAALKCKRSIDCVLPPEPSTRYTVALDRRSDDGEEARTMAR